MTRWKTFLFAAALLAGLGCAVNPVTGQREIVLLSAAQEAEMGRKGAEQFSRELGLVTDPKLVDYVTEIGNRLAVHSPRQDVKYQFAIAGMPEPNAFALPGGYVYVSRGALAIMNSEDELAGVLGHEIGHVAARHSVQAQTRSVGVGLLTLLGAAAAGAAGGESAAQTVGQLGQVAGAGLIATYGRDQERQADQVGQQIAASDGYDPAGIAGFLDTLGRETKRLSGGKNRQPSFFDSHPMTDERVSSALARADDLARGQGRPFAASRAAFISRIEGLQLGPDPAEGLFKDSLFLHPSFGFALQFPRGWKTQNGRDAVLAVAEGGAPALKFSSGGKAGDPEDAARAFEQQTRLPLENGRRLQIGGLDAYRAYATVAGQGGQGGASAIHLTWIGHKKGTFLMMGIVPVADAKRAFRIFDDASGSFRPMTKTERDGIRVRHLSSVAAKPGESLAAVSKRSGNAWTLSETAIANGFAEDVRLRAGERVKIAVETRYKNR